MCTLLSFSKEKFRLHEDEIIAQLRKDAITNDDGSALLLAGKFKTNVSLIKTMDPEVLITILLSEDNWERAWIHNRMATTAFKGLMGTHGFHARTSGDDWYLMHNGRFNHKEASHFNVDSEWMMDLVHRYGISAAMEIVGKNEYFANVFLVAPVEGKWFVMRTKSGTLYTDGQGNYSTNKIEGVVETSVPDDCKIPHTFEVGYKPYKQYPPITDDKKKNGKGSDIILTKGNTDTTDVTRTDTKGNIWKRSPSTGLWLSKSGEVTYIRRLVNGRE